MLVATAFWNYANLKAIPSHGLNYRLDLGRARVFVIDSSALRSWLRIHISFWKFIDLSNLLGKLSFSMAYSILDSGKLSCTMAAYLLLARPGCFICKFKKTQECSLQRLEALEMFHDGLHLVGPIGSFTKMLFICK